MRSVDFFGALFLFFILSHTTANTNPASPDDHGLVIKTHVGNPTKNMPGKITFAKQIKISSSFGVAAYGGIVATGELMNLCDWCWQHHRNKAGRCAINLAVLAKHGAITVGSGIYLFLDSYDTISANLAALRGKVGVLLQVGRIWK